MNIMAELSEVWTSRRKSCDIITRGFVENPLPYFERAFQQVQGMIVRAYTTRNCTYAELLEDARKVDPATVKRYYELFDVVDCDILRKWVDGRLTAEALAAFYEDVESWKKSARDLLTLHQRETSVATRG